MSDTHTLIDQAELPPCPDCTGDVWFVHNRGRDQVACQVCGYLGPQAYGAPEAGQLWREHVRGMMREVACG